MSSHRGVDDAARAQRSAGNRAWRNAPSSCGASQPAIRAGAGHARAARHTSLVERRCVAARAAVITRTPVAR